MSKKVSLQNRKRLKDLMQDEPHVPSDEKRLALEAAQQEMTLGDAPDTPAKKRPAEERSSKETTTSSKAKLSSKKTPLVSATEQSTQKQPVTTKKMDAKASTVVAKAAPEKPEKSEKTAVEDAAPVLDLVSPNSKASTEKSSVHQATSADHFLQARDIAQQLYELFESFNRRSNHNRLEMSRQAQHDALMDVLKKAIAQKASNMLDADVPKARALMICQALIDDVRVLLAQQGVQLNPLHLKQPRQARM